MYIKKTFFLLLLISIIYSCNTKNSNKTKFKFYYNNQKIEIEIPDSKIDSVLVYNMKTKEFEIYKQWRDKYFPDGFTINKISIYPADYILICKTIENKKLDNENTFENFMKQYSLGTGSPIIQNEYYKKNNFEFFYSIETNRDMEYGRNGIIYKDSINSNIIYLAKVDQFLYHVFFYFKDYYKTYSYQNKRNILESIKIE